MVDTPELIFKSDEFEPDEIVDLVEQSLTVVRDAPLNRNGWADYMWPMYTGLIEQVERKQVGEILSDLPGVEEQIRKELQAKPEATLWLLVEGICQPTLYEDNRGIMREGTMMFKSRMCNAYRSYGKREPEEHFVPNHMSKTPYERFQSFLTGLERMGVRVRHTTDYITTAKVLIQMAKSAQSPPTTLQRHNKPQISFHPNPQVMNLLGVYKSGVGVEMAERLINAYGSMWDMAQMNPEDIAEHVPGMGVVSATKLLKAIGRQV